MSNLALISPESLVTGRREHVDSGAQESGLLEAACELLGGVTDKQRHSNWENNIKRMCYFHLDL